MSITQITAKFERLAKKGKSKKKKKKGKKGRGPSNGRDALKAEYKLAKRTKNPEPFIAEEESPHGDWGVWGEDSDFCYFLGDKSRAMEIADEMNERLQQKLGLE